MSIYKSQSRIGSLIESLCNIAIGATVAFVAQLLIFPLYGFTPTDAQDAAITGWFTLISLARSYVVRRLFNSLHALFTVEESE